MRSGANGRRDFITDHIFNLSQGRYYYSQRGYVGRVLFGQGRFDGSILLTIKNGYGRINRLYRNLYVQIRANMDAVTRGRSTGTKKCRRGNFSLLAFLDRAVTQNTSTIILAHRSILM
jgi:hypothetical protein